MSENKQDKKPPANVETKHMDRRQEKRDPQVAALTGVIRVSNTLPAPGKPGQAGQSGKSGKSGEGGKQEK
ncbi:MAG: hypothetical protein J5W83_00790 [Candidatus Accumulibacter sp.]|jgi:hypothetical protein|uniref:hypothetical protein n=1 Tax=Accumulibacter sp. TaxID=2053492 RepID=UPI001B1DFF04|nr:hypothetical protein [Accumulibacter sp.]MBO3701065.1 hypothetical protein [Accumulibacter sp.]